MNKSKLYLGAFFILIGALFLLQNMGWDIKIGFYWPVVLLIPGILFWTSFYQNKKNRSSAILIPGTILIVYSLYFFFNQLNDYNYAGETSFIFTLGIALGFFAAYYYSDDKNKSKGYLIPGWILLAISAVNLLGSTTQWEWWPLFLIALGVFLLYKKDHKSDQNPKHQDDTEKNSESNN